MDYIDQLIAYTNREYDAHTKDIKELWKMSFSERELKGESLGNLVITESNFAVFDGSYTHPAVRIRVKINNSKFRIGDGLVLHRGNPMDNENAYLCEVFEDYETELVIKAGFRVSFDAIYEGDGWFLDRGMMDLRSLVINAISQLQYTDNQEKKTELVAVCQGMMSPQFASERLQKALEMSVDWGFNSRQKEAFIHGFSTENFYTIQGPPGTGKTYLLAKLAVSLAREGQNILISAFTHRAINNALLKISKSENYEKVVKIGQLYKATELENTPIHSHEYFNQSPFNEQDRGLIIGASCFAVTSKKRLAGTFDKVRFDTVIMDEAGQMPIAQGLMTMISAKRYIFVGDHRQMSPIVSAEHENQELTKSIFETIFQHSEGTMLNRTYRMCTEINRFPSEKFYDGNLISDKNTDKLFQNFQQSFRPRHFQTILNPENASVFVKMSHQNRTIRSEEEALLLADLVEESINSGIDPLEIAIVSPFRAQGREIRKKLHQKLGENISEIIITDTVERIQGQEKDLIFISLTTSSVKHAEEIADFYFNTNRLNVAITRPRFKLVVLGSPNLFKAKPSDEKSQNALRVFEEFMNACHLVDSQEM